MQYYYAIDYTFNHKVLFIAAKESEKQAVINFLHAQQFQVDEERLNVLIKESWGFVHSLSCRDNSTCHPIDNVIELLYLALPLQLDIINHELYHLVSRILNKVNLNDNKDNEELRAHYMQFWTRHIMDFLIEYEELRVGLLEYDKRYVSTFRCADKADLLVAASFDKEDKNVIL